MGWLLISYFKAPRLEFSIQGAYKNLPVPYNLPLDQNFQAAKKDFQRW